MLIQWYTCTILDKAKSAARLSISLQKVTEPEEIDKKQCAIAKYYQLGFTRDLWNLTSEAEGFRMVAVL